MASSLSSDGGGVSDEPSELDWRGELRVEIRLRLEIGLQPEDEERSVSSDESSDEEEEDALACPCCRKTFIEEGCQQKKELPVHRNS